VDFDGDGALDVTVGIDFWGDFGPLNGGEGAFNAKGEWTRGKLRGYVYVIRNSSPSTRRQSVCRPVGRMLIRTACPRRCGVISVARVSST